MDETKQQEQALQKLLELVAEDTKPGEGPDKLILDEKMWRLLKYT